MVSRLWLWVLPEWWRTVTVVNKGWDMTMFSAGATIGDVPVEGVYNVSTSGGQYAPERVVEKGFSYASYVGPEAREATIQVMLYPPRLSELDELRIAKSPFPVMVGHAAIRKCKLVDLQVDREASIKSHYKATVKVKQVREVSTGTADLVVDTRNGDGSGAKRTQGSRHPTAVRTKGENKNTSDGGPDGEQIVKEPLKAVTDWVGLTG